MSGRERRDPWDALDHARYISLTTFTRDGTPKATPVWVTGAAGRYYVSAGREAWKTRRLRNTAEVEVRVCDVRGRIEPHTTVYLGSGTVLQDEVSVRAVMRAVDHKYRWQARLLRLVDACRQRCGHGGLPVAIRVDLRRPAQRARSSEEGGRPCGSGSPPHRAASAAARPARST